MIIQRHGSLPTSPSEICLSETSHARTQSVRATTRIQPEHAQAQTRVVLAWLAENYGTLVDSHLFEVDGVQTEEGVPWVDDPSVVERWKNSNRIALVDAAMRQLNATAILPKFTSQREQFLVNDLGVDWRLTLSISLQRLSTIMKRLFELATGRLWCCPRADGLQAWT